MIFGLRPNFRAFCFGGFLIGDFSMSGTMWLATIEVVGVTCDGDDATIGEVGVIADVVVVTVNVFDVVPVVGVCPVVVGLVVAVGPVAVVVVFAVVAMFEAVVTGVVVTSTEPC